MKVTDVSHKPRRLRIDRRPGLYYVMAVDGPRKWVLLGPFKRYGQAARFLRAAEQAAMQADPYLHFATFGVARLPPPGDEQLRLHGMYQGTLNRYLGITSYTKGRKAPWRTKRQTTRAYLT